MDAGRFDAVTGMLGQAHGRRGALRLLGGAIAAVALGRADIGEAKRKSKRRGSPNADNAEFCRTAGCRVTTHGNGAISCDCGNGLYIECNPSGLCHTECVEAEGCTCPGPDTATETCNRGKPGSTPTGPAAPIPDEAKPTGGSAKPVRPGQRPGVGAPVGGGTVKT